LEEVDESLDDLKRNTALLGLTHSPASQAFYAHMAQGASPTILLTDLKGQIDLLAQRMAERG
jgi:hypothetical protein